MAAQMNQQAVFSLREIDPYPKVTDCDTSTWSSTVRLFRSLAQAKREQDSFEIIQCSRGSPVDGYIILEGIDKAISIQVISQNQESKYVQTNIGDKSIMSGPVLRWTSIMSEHVQSRCGIIIARFAEHVAIFSAGDDALQMTQDDPFWSSSREPCPAPLRPFLVSPQRIMERIRQLVNEFRSSGTIAGAVAEVMDDTAMVAETDDNTFAAEYIQDTGTLFNKDAARHKREDLFRFMLQGQLVETGALVKLGFGHPVATDFFIPYVPTPAELEDFRQTGRRPLIFQDPDVVSQYFGVPVNIKRLHQDNNTSGTDEHSHEKMGEVLVPRDAHPTIWLIDSLPANISIGHAQRGEGIPLLMIPSEVMNHKFGPVVGQLTGDKIPESRFFTHCDSAIDNVPLEKRLAVLGGLDKFRIEAHNVAHTLVRICQDDSTQALTGVAAQGENRSGIVTTLKHMLDLQVTKKLGTYKSFNTRLIVA